MYLVSKVELMREGTIQKDTKKYNKLVICYANCVSRQYLTFQTVYNKPVEQCTCEHVKTIYVNSVNQFIMAYTVHPTVWQQL